MQSVINRLGNFESAISEKVMYGVGDIARNRYMVAIASLEKRGRCERIRCDCQSRFSKK